MKDSIPSQLIDKYLNGDCSIEEEIQLMDWYNSSDSNIDPIELLTEKQQEQLKFKILGKIRQKAYVSNQSETNRKPLRFIYYAAATIAVAVFFVFGFYKRKDLNNKIAKSIVVESKTITVKNSSQNLMKHVLPDNSNVWLKPDAAINYSKNFNTTYRSVTLKGEAFFEVEKDKLHPFIIYCGGVVTRVLGTSFNVKAIEQAGVTEVSVVTGKVFVYTPASKNQVLKSVYLLPEQKVTYLKSKHQLVKHVANEPSLTIWKKNTLSFDNVSVFDVAQTLNKTFNSKIIITDKSINQYLLKADFTDVNLPTIIELLSKSLNLNYIIQGDEILVSRKSETELTTKPNLNVNEETE